MVYCKAKNPKQHLYFPRRVFQAHTTFISHATVSEIEVPPSSSYVKPSIAYRRELIEES